MLNLIFALVLLAYLPVSGHEPKGVVYPIWNFPDGRELLFDDPPSDSYEIFDLWGEFVRLDTIYEHSSTRMRNADGEAPDPNDFRSKMYISWDAIYNKIYVQEYRYDNEFNSEFRCGDYIGFKFNPNHLDKQPNLWADTYIRINEEGVAFPGRWPDFTPWYLKPPYVEVASVFENDLLYIQSSWTLWDVLGDSPETSVEFQLEEGQIIGLSWEFWDCDDNIRTDRWFSVGHLPGSGVIEHAMATSDFVLEPENGSIVGFPFFWDDHGVGHIPEDESDDDVEDDESSVDVETDVARQTWGSIKDLFLNR